MSPLHKANLWDKPQQMARLKVHTLHILGPQEDTKTLLMHLLC